LKAKHFKQIIIKVENSFCQLKENRQASERHSFVCVQNFHPTCCDLNQNLIFLPLKGAYFRMEKNKHCYNRIWIYQSVFKIVHIVLLLTI